MVIPSKRRLPLPHCPAVLRGLADVSPGGVTLSLSRPGAGAEEADPWVSANPCPVSEVDPS